MQRKLLFLSLLGGVFLFSLSALEPTEMYGTWSWGEPIYSEGVMGVDGYTDYTLYISYPTDDGTMFYTMFDEDNKVLHKGTFLLADGLLNFSYNTAKGGNDYQYTYSQGPFGGLELCEYHDYPSQNAYFSISKKSILPSVASKTLNNAECYETALGFALGGMKQEDDKEEQINSLFQYAYALGALGLHDEAVSFWDLYLKSKPNDSQARNNLEWNRNRMVK